MKINRPKLAIGTKYFVAGPGVEPGLGDYASVISDYSECRTMSSAFSLMNVVRRIVSTEPPMCIRVSSALSLISK
jgi:hypothetical protein